MTQTTDHPLMQSDIKEISGQLISKVNEVVSTELERLKQQLVHTQAQKASRLEDSLFSPNLYEHYQKIANILSKSDVIPKGYQNKPNDVFVAMAMGYQLGFGVEQSLQNISVINGRPCLWGDGLLSLVLSHPDCESLEEIPLYKDKGGEVVGYKCIVKRAGHPPHQQIFTLNDAQRAGLLSRGNVWKSYPQRMLQMRARSLAIRDKFADILCGLRIAEVENEDSMTINGQAKEIAPKASYSQTEKIKHILNAQKDDTYDISSQTTDYSQSVSATVETSAPQDKRADVLWDGGNSMGNIGEPQSQDFDENQSADSISLQTQEKEKLHTYVYKLIKSQEMSDERYNKMLAHYKVNYIHEMSMEQLKDLIKKLSRKSQGATDE